MSELDWPLWDLARCHQDPDPLHTPDLDEDVLTKAEAQDPLETKNLDNLFITLTQLGEKVASVIIAATIIKRPEETTATITASKVEQQLQEKFHTIIKCGGLITDEPLWRKSTGNNSQTDGRGSTTSKRGHECKDEQSEIVSSEEDSSRQPKKRKVHNTQHPFECGNCGRLINSQSTLNTHRKTCVGRCQNCERHGFSNVTWVPGAYARIARRTKSTAGFFRGITLFEAPSKHGNALSAGVCTNAPTDDLFMRTNAKGDATPAEITHPLYLVGILILYVSHALNVQKAAPNAVSLNV